MGVITEIDSPGKGSYSRLFCILRQKIYCFDPVELSPRYDEVNISTHFIALSGLFTADKL